MSLHFAATDHTIELISNKAHLSNAVLAMMTGDPKYVSMANAAYAAHKSGVGSNITPTAEGASQTAYSAKPLNIGGPVAGV